MVGVRHPQGRRSPRQKKGLIECCAKLRSTREMRANGWMVALLPSWTGSVYPITEGRRPYSRRNDLENG